MRRLGLPSRVDRVRLAVAVGIAVGAFSQSAAAATPFAKGPYLQQLGPTGVEVRVELGAPAPASVDVSADVSADATAHGDAGAATQTVADSASSTFHVVRVSGLTPSTRYRYVVHAGSATSDAGTFVTAPADDSAVPFTFVVYGDNRSDDDTHRLVTRAILATPSDFLLHTGDFAYAGGDDREWQTFFDIERTLLRDRCVFSSVGNHELNGDPGAAAYERYLGPPQGKLYGTFRWGSARFFLLNAFTRWDGGEAREWLERELTKADAEPGLAWRFAVIHHGPFSSGRHGPNKDIGAAQVPELLSRHKVDLVISGHDHIYERGEATSPSYDLRYLVSGGAGAPLYDEHTPRAYTKRFEAAHNFVEVDVAGDHVTLAARRPDGSMLEQCGFGHASGWDCDAAPASSSSAAPSAPTLPKLADPPAASGPSRCGCASSARGPGDLLLLGISFVGLVALRAFRRRAS